MPNKDFEELGKEENTTKPRLTRLHMVHYMRAAEIPWKSSTLVKCNRPGSSCCCTEHGGTDPKGETIRLFYAFLRTNGKTQNFEISL